MKGIKIYFIKFKKQKNGFQTIKPTATIIEVITLSKRDKTPILVYSYMSLQKNATKRVTACLPLIEKTIMIERPELEKPVWSTGRLFFTKKEDAEKYYNEIKERLNDVKCNTTCDDEISAEKAIREYNQ